jgi:4-carboxymuconolactone decarboxylase
MGREVELRSHIGGGLNHGLTRDEVDEIFVQAAAYVGVPFGLAGARIAGEVFAELDGTEERTTPPAPLELKDPEQRRADGLELLKTLLGMPDLDTKQTEQQILASQGDMGHIVMDYAFGDVWMRPQLSRRDRSMVVISCLTALNLKHELEIHIGGALNHNVTEEEVEEVMITLVIYGGFPRAIDGMMLARKVFEARSAS